MKQIKAIGVQDGDVIGIVEGCMVYKVKKSEYEKLKSEVTDNSMMIKAEVFGADAIVVAWNRSELERKLTEVVVKAMTKMLNKIINE